MHNCNDLKDTFLVVDIGSTNINTKTITVLGHATCYILQTLTSANQSGFSIPGMENCYWLAYN